MKNLDLAISIVAQAFVGKSDKGGHPYVLHCLHVMNQMDPGDAELRCIAVLHDLVEDTTWTIEDLRKLGFSERVLIGVDTLTHKNDMPYDDYIKLIAMYPDARKVKLADLKHNSDITRMKGLRKKDFDRLEKYHRSFAYLSE